MEIHGKTIHAYTQSKILKHIENIAISVTYIGVHIVYAPIGETRLVLKYKYRINGNYTTDNKISCCGQFHSLLPASSNTSQAVCLE